MQGLRWVMIMAGAQAFLALGTAHAGGPAADLIVNGDFTDGLRGWTVREFGGGAAPGAIAADANAVTFDEGHSFLVQLEQRFVVPAGTSTCWVRFAQAPAFDRQASFIPDAFEVSLLDGRRSPVVAPWRAGATSFFDLEESGVVHLGAGTTFDGTTIAVPTVDVPPGTEVDIVLSLVGGDSDHGSRVAIGGVGCQLEPTGGEVSEGEGEGEDAPETTDVEAVERAEAETVEAVEAVETTEAEAETETETAAPETEETEPVAEETEPVSEPIEEAEGTAEASGKSAEGCGCAAGTDPTTTAWMAIVALILGQRRARLRAISHKTKRAQ